MEPLNTLRITYLVNTISGLSYYDFDGVSSGGKISYFIACIIFYCFNLLNTFKLNFQIANKSATPFNHLILLLVNILNLLAGLSSVLKKCSNREEHVTLLKTSMSVTHKIRRSGFRSKCKKSRSIIMCIIMTYFLVHLIIIVGDGSKTLPLKAIEYHFCHMPLIDFLSYILLLKQGYQDLTQTLEKIGQNQRNLTDQEIIARVKVIAELHVALRKVTYDVNSLFKVPTTAMLFAIFLSLSSDIYNMTTTLWISRATMPERYEILYFMLTLLSVILMCGYCDEVAEEANRAVDLMHQLHQEDSSPALLLEIETFSIGLHSSKVQFLVEGFFTLDRKLLTKMAVMILFYVVVAFHFHSIHWNRPQGTTSPY